jgi:putative restriction endonuclease
MASAFRTLCSARQLLVQEAPVKINQFFEHRLGVTLRNHVWSWGAANPATNRVFLRASAYPDRKTVLVYDPEWRKSPGHRERLAHLEDIRNGCDAFIVVVQFDEEGEKIRSFEEDKLLVVGGLLERNRCTYARVVDEVSLEQLAALPRGSSETEDVLDVMRQGGLMATKRKALIDARLGQGRFRRDVLSLWQQRCAVTGISAAQAIRASHIQPWRDSTDAEKLDPLNGLPLIATLDALFDSGLITFEPSGRIRISSQLSPDDIKRLSLRGVCLTNKPRRKTAEYLSFHAANRFRE